MLGQIDRQQVSRFTVPDTSTFSEERLERLQGMLKRRGVILPAFEIHGGSKGLFDFGPIGGRLRNKIQQQWLHHWLSQGDIVEISSPTITPYSVLEASGHVSEFTDFMVDCNQCGEASRADTLIESEVLNADALSIEELKDMFSKISPNCPDCGHSDWSDIRAQNLMFNTSIGVGASGKAGFLRPETAQGMFTLFPSLYRHFREKLPFGAVQIGKGYRNEISPRQGMIRLREFNMAELEYFIDPESTYSHDFRQFQGSTVSLISDEYGELRMSFEHALEQGIIRHPTVAYFLALTHKFLLHVGIQDSLLRFRQHKRNEMAHYAQDCWDAEIFGSFGWVECVGIAHRGCYDLEAHEKYTGKQLRARREFETPQTRIIDGWTMNLASAGPAFRQYSQEVKTKIEALPTDSTFPMTFHARDGEVLTILEEHVKRDQREEKVSGEWFIPHVVEPAFGIDRIIWHILDHAYDESQKEGEAYNFLRLASSITPIDVCVFPLFEKDGMDDLGKEIHKKLLSRHGFFATYDGSGSIGRRYARADEIGVPLCITIDHQSLEDSTFTIRHRDDGSQERLDLHGLLVRMNSIQ